MLHSEYLEEEAAKIAVSVMREYEKEFDEIVACCFNAGDKASYERLLSDEVMSEYRNILTVVVLMTNGFGCADKFASK